jgi:hypothetical protein
VGCAALRLLPRDRRHSSSYAQWRWAARVSSVLKASGEL